MAWTAPVTRATGYVVLASVWNNEHVNNLLYLHGDAGQIVLNDAITKLLEGFNAAAGSVPITFTPATGSGLVQRFTVSGGGASTLTIGAPTGPPSGSQTAFMVVRIVNTGGGTITLTWNAAFTASGVTALPANMANNAQSNSLFVWDGASTKWFLLAVN